MSTTDAVNAENQVSVEKNADTPTMPANEANVETQSTSESTDKAEETTDTVSNETSQEESEDEIVLPGEQEPEKTADEDESFIAKDLRRVIKSKDRKLAELERKLQEIEAGPQVKQSESEIKKPDLNDYDDIESYERDMVIYTRKSIELESVGAQKKQELDQFTQDYNARVALYESQKQTIKGVDFEEAEAVIDKALSKEQKAFLMYAKSSERVVAALYKYPDRLEKVRKLTNPVEFIYAISDIANAVQVQKRQSPSTPPESTTAVASKLVDNRSESDIHNEIEEKCKQSGDYTELMQYYRKKNK